MTKPRDSFHPRIRARAEIIRQQTGAYWPDAMNVAIDEELEAHRATLKAKRALTWAAYDRDGRIGGRRGMEGARQ